MAFFGSIRNDDGHYREANISAPGSQDRIGGQFVPGRDPLVPVSSTADVATATHTLNLRVLSLTIASCNERLLVSARDRRRGRHRAWPPAVRLSLPRFRDAGSVRADVRS